MGSVATSERRPTTAKAAHDQTPISSQARSAAKDPASEFIRLGSSRSLRELGYELVNSLCNRFQCEQVGLGVVASQRVRMIAISGYAQFKLSSPGVVDMSQAMEECLDQGRTLMFPPESDELAFPIHQAWAIASGGARVCSLPLAARDTIVGVLCLRRPGSSPFQPDELETLRLAAPNYAVMLSLVERANRPMTRQLADSARSALLARRSLPQCLAALICIFALGWFLFGQITYRPLCDATVVPSGINQMNAPFEAKLEKVHVRAGDTVNCGDLLGEFDTGEIKSELETVRAEVAKAGISARAAVDAGDASTAAIHRAQARVLEARASALECRIRRAQIMAPADGMIVESSFDNRVGQVYQQGEQVLKFAPHEGWRLHIRVPEEAAVFVTSTQRGLFAPAARPHEAIGFVIEYVNGSAEVIDGENVFVANALLETAPTWARSGMKGIVHVDTIQRPVWWVACHKLIDWARLRFWI